MMRLTVHLNSLARFRAAGNHAEPDLFTSALAADLAGADGIVCQLEEGKAVIPPRDIAALKRVVHSHLTVEVEPSEALVRAAMEIKPQQVTLVPPTGTALEEGVDVLGQNVALRELVRSLHAAAIDVSVLVRPVIDLVKEARKIEVDAVTLNVAAYARSGNAQDAVVRLEEIEAAALGANRLGLAVFASRGIDHRNIAPLASFGTIDEAILGQRLFARSFFVGLDRALGEIRDAVRWRSGRA